MTDLPEDEKLNYAAFVYSELSTKIRDSYTELNALQYLIAEATLHLKYLRNK